MKKKSLTEQIIQDVQSEVILMFLNCAHQQINAGKESWWNANNGYYAEAHGIMRGMVIAGYCYFGANNFPEEKQNAKWWFGEIQDMATEAIKKFGVVNAIKMYDELCMETYNQARKNFKQ